MILTTISVGYTWEGRNKSRGTGGTGPRWLKHTCLQTVQGSALRWEVKGTAIYGDQKVEGSSPLEKPSGEPARRWPAGGESKDTFKIQWITEAKLQRLELSFPEGRRGDASSRGLRRNISYDSKGRGWEKYVLSLIPCPSRHAGRVTCSSHLLSTTLQLWVPLTSF